MEKRKIVASGCYWVCENMDLLAPIIEEGVEYLLNDSTRIRVANSKQNDILKDLEWANDEEMKQYVRINYGVIFKGDEVIIKRGRKMVGEHKIVDKTFRYFIEGTYQKQYTDYLVFTDGTKVNINHCDTIGVEYKPFIYQGKEYYFRRFEIGLSNTLFSVGGRV